MLLSYEASVELCWSVRPLGSFRVVVSWDDDGDGLMSSRCGIFEVCMMSVLSWMMIIRWVGRS